MTLSERRVAKGAAELDGVNANWRSELRPAFEAVESESANPLFRADMFGVLCAYARLQHMAGKYDMTYRDWTDKLTDNQLESRGVIGTSQTRPELMALWRSEVGLTAE